MPHQFSDEGGVPGYGLKSVASSDWGRADAATQEASMAIATENLTIVFLMSVIREGLEAECFEF